MLAAIFQPTPWDWLLGAGIGTNLGAALVGVLLGVIWSRTKFWPLRPLRRALDDLHRKHDASHELLEELHHLAHIGRPHPRALARYPDSKETT